MNNLKILIAPVHYKIDRAEGSEYARAHDYLMYLSKRADVSGDALVYYSELKNIGGIKIHSLTVNNPKYISSFIRIKFILWIFIKSTMLIIKNNYDIIWHNGPFAIGETFSLVSIFNFRNIPFILGPIVTPHVYVGGDEYRSMGSKISSDSLVLKLLKTIDSKIYIVASIFRILSDLTLSRSALVLMKENEGKKLICHIKNIKTKVLNLGLNINNTQNNKKYKRNKTIRVLSVSYFVRRKNITDLISAMDYIVNKLKLVSYRLYLVGDGPDMSNIVHQVSEKKLKKYVKFLGFVKKENVFKHYIKSDIFVSTSLSDSMPAMYFEAMSAGLPIVMYSNPSSKELVGKGAKIYQVTSGNYEEIAKAIISITKNDKMFKFGKINQFVYSTKLSFEVNMNKFIKILKNFKNTYEN